MCVCVCVCTIVQLYNISTAPQTQELLQNIFQDIENERDSENEKSDCYQQQLFKLISELISSSRIT